MTTTHGPPATAPTRRRPAAGCAPRRRRRPAARRTRRARAASVRAGAGRALSAELLEARGSALTTSRPAHARQLVLQRFSSARDETWRRSRRCRSGRRRSGSGGGSRSCGRADGEGARAEQDGYIQLSPSRSWAERQVLVCSGSGRSIAEEFGPIRLSHVHHWVKSRRRRPATRRRATRRAARSCWRGRTWYYRSWCPGRAACSSRRRRPRRSRAPGRWRGRGRPRRSGSGSTARTT